MSETTADLPARPALIAGRTFAPDWIEVTDPADGRAFARVARCGPAEVDEAVAAARRAFDGGWPDTAVAERARICRAVADALRADSAALAEVETRDTGKPISQARADVDVAARYFEFYGGVIEAPLGQTVVSSRDLVAFTVREPYGVCGHIIPWNYPLQIAARTLAPALATGNCCVLKPAEDAPLSALRLAELANAAGLPAGVLSVVPGYGAEAGAALAAHPGVDHLAFTGSRVVGESVLAAAAPNILPVALELGGKSPHLVFPDADLDAAVPHLVSSITDHAGQNCSAGSRLLVHRRIQRDLVERLAGAFRALRIGPGAEDPDVGPLISERQRTRVLGYVEQGRRDLRLVCGGGIPAEWAGSGGFYTEPTIFDDVPRDHRLFQEEVFGPVLAVTPFDTLEEALSLANGTSYGLAAGVWTQDVGQAHWLARRLQVGQVFVNTYSAAGGVELPFAPSARSGIGVEKGFEALFEYTHVKTAVINAVPARSAQAGPPGPARDQAARTAQAAQSARSGSNHPWPAPVTVESVGAAAGPPVSTTTALDQVHVALSAANKLLTDVYVGVSGREPAAEPARAPKRDEALILTPREREVLERVAEGKSNRQVAISLGIAEKTVKNHLSAIFAKTGAADRTQAVMRGIRGGMITVAF